MSIWRRSTAMTRQSKTRFASTMAAAFSIPMFSQRTDCCSSLRPFARFLCCSIVITTYVILIHITLIESSDRPHQYIARKLLEINERGTWVDPTGKKATDLTQQDEEIFQIARLCNCAWFAGIVFSDYFSNILGLVREGNPWSLAPFGVR